MKFFTLVMVSVFLLYGKTHAQVKRKNITTALYSYCEAENGQCMKKCTVKLIKGATVAIGSYVKVYIGNEIIAEGYILKHVSGSLFILKDKKDANNPEICGGCCGGAYEIKISKKQIWGC